MIDLFFRNAHLHPCLTALMHTSDAQYGLQEMLTGRRKHSSEEGHVQLSWRCLLITRVRHDHNDIQAHVSSRRVLAWFSVPPCKVHVTSWFGLVR